MSYEPYLPKYGHCGDFEVGDTVHRVGEMVQQAGDIGSSSENKNLCVFLTKTKVNVTLPRAYFGLNIVFHFTLPLNNQEHLRTFSIPKRVFLKGCQADRTLIRICES